MDAPSPPPTITTTAYFDYSFSKQSFAIRPTISPIPLSSSATPPPSNQLWLFFFGYTFFILTHFFQLSKLKWHTRCYGLWNRCLWSEVVFKIIYFSKYINQSGERNVASYLFLTSNRIFMKSVTFKPVWWVNRW